MSTYILTSMFQTGFPGALVAELIRVIPQAARFAFVASEFEKLPEKTDKYFRRFLEMFTACGIEFSDVAVVDGRMTPSQAQRALENADVVWLSGGDTPVQYGYFEKYGLIDVLRRHKGVVIGMSAGAINMAERAVCTVACGHDRQYVYPALGLVNFSVEPHLNSFGVTEEHLKLSEIQDIYGLCDEAAVLCEGENIKYIGKVFRIAKRQVQQISFG